MRKPKTVTIPEAGLSASPPVNFLRLCFRTALLLSWLMFCAGASLSLARPIPSGKNPSKPYALIYGTVWGPDNRPLYGVKIRIRRVPEKKVRWELYSDHSGEFAQRVPAGKVDYAVSADLRGYKFSSGKQLRLGEDVIVHIENDERADIGLHLTQ
jgi:hypothetical protein